MIFAIAMDYTVFLLSSAKEHFDRSGDPQEAMIGGVAHSGRVIFAAAGVMIAVFFTFAPRPLPPKEMGVILGVAVLLDAMLIRLVSCRWSCGCSAGAPGCPPCGSTACCRTSASGMGSRRPRESRATAWRERSSSAAASAGSRSRRSLRRLVGEDHEIVLVDRGERFSMGLRKLWSSSVKRPSSTAAALARRSRPRRARSPRRNRRDPSGRARGDGRRRDD